MNFTDLPAGNAPQPVQLPHFPTRFQAVLWRNWGLVPLEKLAQPWDGNTHVIAIVPQQPTAEATQTLKSEFQRRVIGKKVLLLNLWFTGARLSSGAVCDGAVYYLEPGAVSSQFQSELLTAFGDKISFYRIIFPQQAQ